ncbi:MAG: DUF2341 domain-containing protein [Kiritimatiellia bacterium]
MRRLPGFCRRALANLQGLSRISLILLAGAIAFEGRSETVSESLFAYKSTILVSGYAGSTELTDFPLMVKLSAASPEGFSYDDCTGENLRFADADGNILPHEIDTWNPEGTSIVWVRVPTLSGTATELTMLWGNDGDGYEPTASDVWTPSGHNAVWHFSGNGNDSVNGLEPSTVTGAPDYTDTSVGVGTALLANGSSTIGFANDDKWAALGEGSCLTVSLWSKYDATSWNYARMISCMDAWTEAQGWEITIQNAKDQITVGSSGQSQYQYTATGVGPCTAPAYLTVVYHADKTAELYINGVSTYSKTLNQVVKPTKTLWIACCKGSSNFWNGKLDEIRIHRAEESADWIKACYDTMTSDAFVTLGDVTSTGAETPLVLRDNGFVQTGDTATISGRLANIGSAATSATVKLYWSTTETVDDTCAFVDLGTFTDKSDLTATLTDLTPGGKYYYAFCAVNDASEPETVWTDVNSFVVDASTRVATPEIVAENCLLTVTAPIESWGVGTTTFELLVGTSEDNLVVVDTIADVSSMPEGDAVTFAPIQLGIGTYVYVVRATTTYGEIVWVNETSATNNVTLSDASTYVYKGGTGTWNDTAMWSTSDTGAVGYPTDGCSVEFGEEDSDVTVTANIKLKNLTISSVGTHAFRTPSTGTTYTLSKSGTTTLSGAGGGTLVLDNVILDGRVESLAGLKLLAVVNNGQIFPANSETTDVMLVNGGCLYSGWENGKVFGKLILVGGPNRIASYGNNYTFSFASLETRPGTGVSMAVVADGKVTIRDPSTVEMVGGTQTLEDAGSQIPVCTQFTISAANSAVRYGKNLCTMDADGVIRMIPQTTMLTSLEGATELDNVSVPDGTTLASDVTVNAAVFSGATVNLDGHTITVKSGQIREGTAGMWNHVVSNGTFRLCKPNAIGDSTNNSDVRMKVDFATDGNADINVSMLALDAMNSGYPNSATYLNFIGTVAPPFGAAFAYSSSMRSPNAVLELRGESTLKPSGHYQKANFRGLAGTGRTDTYSTGWKPLLWLGTMDEADQAYFDEKAACIIVGNGGFLCPGYIDYDGGRRGFFTVVYGVPQGDIPRFTTLEFRPGSTFMVTVRKDGSCSFVKATASHVATEWVAVNLDGELEVNPVGRIVPGVQYPVLTYHEGKRTGKFESVTDGFKVSYDVLQPDGNYAVTVEKKESSFFILVR